MKLDEAIKQKAPKTMKLLSLLSWGKKAVATSAVSELCEAIEHYVDFRCKELQAQIDELKKD